MTRRRLRGDGFGSVPVVLPGVVVRLDGADAVTVTLDGQAVSEGPIPRVQMGEALSQIIDQVGTAIRVEIHDPPDGTVHADILTPPAQQPDKSAQASERPLPSERRHTSEVLAGGLQAGRPAHAAAPVVAAATRTGEHVSKRLDPKPVPDWYEPSSPTVCATSRTSRLQGLA